MRKPQFKTSKGNPVRKDKQTRSMWVSPLIDNCASIRTTKHMHPKLRAVIAAALRRSAEGVVAL